MRIEPETRAEIARRRLAELAASFDAQVPLAEGGRHTGERRSSRRLGPVHTRFVAVLAVAASVLIAWWLLAARPTVSDSLAFSASAGPSSTVPAPTSELVIDVVGRVRHPGIVTLPAGSRVHEAIAAAGGVQRGVDTSGLNLARKLTDGEQVLIGTAPVASAASGAAGGPADGVLDLNTATEQQLEDLPGIGPVTAAAIVGWRTENGPFHSVEDLLDVTGIGEKTLEQLRDHVRV
jgi:competence protein ComEA